MLSQPTRLPSMAEQAALRRSRLVVQGLFIKVVPQLWWSPSQQGWIIALPFDNGFPPGVQRLPPQVNGVPLVPVAVPPAAVTGAGATLVDGVERPGIRRGADGLGTQLLFVSGRPMVRPVGGPPASAPGFDQRLAATSAFARNLVGLPLVEAQRRLQQAGLRFAPVGGFTGSTVQFDLVRLVTDTQPQQTVAWAGSDADRPPRTSGGWVVGTPASIACTNWPLPTGNPFSMSPVVEVYDPLASAPACPCSCDQTT